MYTGQEFKKKSLPETINVNFKRGVPQKSVLGPVLFLLLTNDNWVQDSCHTVMNADDTVLTISNKSIETSERKTNNIFYQTKDYCSKNNLV